MRAYLGAGIVLTALYAAFKLKKKNVSSIFIGIKFSVVNCMYLVPKWSICVSLIYVRGKKNIYIYMCIYIYMYIHTHTYFKKCKLPKTEISHNNIFFPSHFIPAYKTQFCISFI